MNTKLAALLLGAILIIGGGVYFATRSDDTSQNAESRQSTQTDENSGSQSEGENSGMEFAAVANLNEPFTADIMGSTESGDFTGKLEYDGQGNSKFSTTSANGSTEFYFVNDIYISCQAGECFSLPSTGPSPFDIDNYAYSDEDFDKFKESTEYLGRQDCPAGTCDVWQANENGLVTQIFISTQDKRISKVVGTENDIITTITYTFGPVTIEAPADVQESPTL